jgi:hypothetical protein
MGLTAIFGLKGWADSAGNAQEFADAEGVTLFNPFRKEARAAMGEVMDETQRFGVRMTLTAISLFLAPTGVGALVAMGAGVLAEAFWAFKDTVDKSIPDKLGDIQKKIDAGEAVSFQQLGNTLQSLAGLHDKKLEKGLEILLAKAEKGDEFAQGVLFQTAMHAMSHIQSKDTFKHQKGDAFSLVEFVKSGRALQAVEAVKQQLPEAERMQAEMFAQRQAARQAAQLGAALPEMQRFEVANMMADQQPSPGENLAVSHATRQSGSGPDL